MLDSCSKRLIDFMAFQEIWNNIEYVVFSGPDLVTQSCWFYLSALFYF